MSINDFEIINYIEKKVNISLIKVKRKIIYFIS